MITRTLDVTVTVEVTIDETKFTKEFMDEFNRTICPMNREEHFKNIAHAEVFGIISGFCENQSLEGYGNLKDMGISTVVLDEDVDFAVGYQNKEDTP